MIIMICEEYPAHPGGVAHFSKTLAKGLMAEKKLKGLISLSSYRPEPGDLKVFWVKLPRRRSFPKLDRYVLIRKFLSLLSRVYTTFYYFFRDPIGRALKKLNYDSRKDVLFFTYQVHFPGLALSLRKKYGSRIWLLYHGLDLLDAKKYALPVQKTVDQAEKVFFNSNATAKLFDELGFHCRNFEVKYPTIDTAYLEQLDLLTIGQLEDRFGVSLKGKFIITSVCRLVKRKGIHFAIDIIADLVKENYNVIYLIVGTGPEMMALQQKVDKLKLNEYILILGFVSDIEKYSLLNASCVFLMPNYDDGGNDFEGFGISFLEAGYFDNFVIGGNHGGAVEALRLVPNSKAFNFPDEVDRSIEYLEKLLYQCLMYKD
jgi:phosphatidylinositol alpha-1,6-mannosyltransferase